jgi:predicted transcriptional regulator
MARKIVIHTRITPELKAALEKAADETKWSESLIVSEALELWLNSRKPKAR